MAGAGGVVDVKERLVAALDDAGLTDQRAIDLAPDHLVDLHGHLIRRGLRLQHTSQKQKRRPKKAQTPKNSR